MPTTTITITTFFDLKAWQVAHALTLKIYEITKDFPQSERFGITSQLQRAASSITANIAEGFARYHYKDKARFYYQSRGSAAEVLNFLVLARDLNYVDTKMCATLMQQANEVGRLINGLIKSMERQSTHS
jgi:four helix bundle protein